MKSDTLPMLRSPQLREPMRLENGQGPSGGSQQFLVSEPSGRRYEVRDGIPVLLDQATVAGTNLRYQTAYNRVARLYDPLIRIAAWLAGGNEERFRKQYLKELEIRPGGRVLEVSVGTGANLRLLPPGAQYFGLDISWGMLVRCRSNLRAWRADAELIMGNAEALPFQDDSFDVAFHVGGINAFSDRARALSEMVRVARGGCKLLVVDESAKLMKALSWAPTARRMPAEWGDRFQAPVGLVPAGMAEVEVKPLLNGWFYCLTFRKP